MGRPAKFYIRIHISLSNEQLEEIDRRAGMKGRSAAMREAADQWISAQKESQSRKGSRKELETRGHQGGQQ